MQKLELYKEYVSETGLKFFTNLIENYPDDGNHMSIHIEEFKNVFKISKGEDSFPYTDAKDKLKVYKCKTWLVETNMESSFLVDKCNFDLREFRTHEAAIKWCLKTYKKFISEEIKLQTKHLLMLNDLYYE